MLPAGYDLHDNDLMRYSAVRSFASSPSSVRRAAVVAALATVATVSSNAQTSPGAGGSAVPFLMISPTARAGGMGEVGTGLIKDVNATFYNIGGLGFSQSTQVAYNYSKWLPQFNADLHYHYLSGATYIPDLDGTVSGHVTILDLGEFQQTYDNGTAGAKFRSTEFSIGAGYATKLGEEVGAGLQARYIRSDLASGVQLGNGQTAKVGESVGFDIGVMYTPDWKWEDYGLPKDFLTAGLTFANIGPKIYYVDITKADPLPTTFRAGLGVHVVSDEFNDLSVALDINKLLVNRPSDTEVDPVPKSLVTAWGNGKGVEFSLGAEYWYDKVIALRGGYFTEPEVSGNRRFFTFGAGVRYSMFGLDFSYISPVEENHPLAGTLRFSGFVDFSLDK